MFRTFCMACLYLIAAATFASEGTVVYKSEDESGTPVFSDQETPASEEIIIEDPITFPAEVFKNDSEAFGYEGIRSESQPEQPVTYDTLLISSPTDQQTIRNNAGNLTVKIMPTRIASQHQLQLLMDGNVMAVYDGNPFELENLDRGTHVLQLQISHIESGKVYTSGPAVNFTMLRYSKLHRKNPKLQRKN